jgi:hypothetical protein
MNENTNSVTYPVSDRSSAHARLLDYFYDNYGFDEFGNLDVPNDGSMLSDMWTFLKQGEAAMLAVATITSGVLSKCEHEVKYAGNVKSTGNRIFTPLDVAKHAITDIKEIENKRR